jgi:SAM-dependent methyltransferase
MKMEEKYKVGDLIYDANIYDGLNTFLSDLPFYKKWLPKNKDARILELCCGTGRLTLPIAKDGYYICGVDYTSSMLEQAKAKASEAGLEIAFIEADIRTLNLQQKFDLIFIPFNSIHHLYENEDLFKVLNVVKNHLKDGGLFLLDCFNPNIQYIVEAAKEQQEIAAYTTSDGREVLIKQTMRYENKTQINRIEWHYFINGAFNSTQNLDMRMFFPKELDSYLEWAGFNVIHKFGGFEEETFNDNSEKQVYVLVLKTENNDMVAIDTKSIALQFNECITNADLNGLSNLMTEDYIFIDTANNRIKGKDNNIVQAWQPFFNLYPGYRNIFENIVVRGSTVIMQGYSICSDEILNNIHAIWVVEIIKNKVGSWHIYADTKENRELFDL